eukprot:TRINITY_DN58666_c0_g1_i1.p1 TRINITY_DN58666_c0_g1~~TRINITY_DN58666_c0_g1_i1.p1  ORF type:complete len:430 (-),score=92.95 TRINITY_DN58666_c0_g1_i1:98-1273(-)
MEVTVKDVRGIDGEAIMSIRAGAARRQAPLSPDTPLQFPSLPLNANPLKIDLLRQIGSCKVALRSSQAGGPAPEIYSVLFPNEGGGTSISMDVQVQEMPHLCGPTPGGGLFANNLPQPVGGQVPQDSGEMGGPGGGNSGMDTEKKAAVAEEARAYLKRFGLLGFLQELLQYIIRERPDDPFVFMAAYLMRVTGYKDPNAAAAAAATLETSGGGARAASPTLGDSPEEAAMTALQRQNARLDAENERIRQEIAKFQIFCDQTLAPGQTPFIADDIVADDCASTVGPAAAALDGALRMRRDELASTGMLTAQHEDLSRAVSTFCQGFSDLASRLAVSLSKPGAELYPSTIEELEQATANKNAQLEAENQEMNRQIQELERSLNLGPGDEVILQ